MLWAFLSAKGSPGATTTALAATAAFGEGALMAELDPAGGDVAARAHVACEPPGLMTLAAAGRRGVTPEMLVEHLSVVGPGLPVLLAPSDGAQAAASLTKVAASLGPALAAVPAHVFADCGRWAPGSPSTEVLDSAVAAVVVLRPEAAQIEHARCILPSLRAACPDVAVVLVGRLPWGSDEVAGVLGADVLGVVEHDSRAAAGLARATTAKRVKRTSLVRSVATIIDELVGRARPVGALEAAG